MSAKSQSAPSHAGEQTEPMLGRLIALCFRHRGVVLYATGAVMLLGIWSLGQLPLDAVPDLTNVQVQVNTPVQALAPEEIERQVTFPMETELGGVPGVSEVRSLTKYGLSQVTLIFDEGTDIFRARQLVSERITAVSPSLPAGTAPLLGPITTGLGEIVQYALVDERVRPGESEVDRLTRLRVLHDWEIKPRLRSVKGLAEVNAIGGYEPQIHVLVDPAKLAEAGASFDEIVSAVNAANENAGGGYIQAGGRQTVIRSVGRIESPDDLNEVPMRLSPFQRSRVLRDLARIEPGHELRTGAATLNGQEAVIGTAMMLLRENSRTVARAVIDRINEVNAALPAGIRLLPLYNRDELVENTIRTVRNNLMEGAVLVVAVLFLFLGNFRAACIVASSIPLSMLVAAIGMVQGRVSANLMSLGAVDFGLIVDGAVIVVENCVRRVGERARSARRTLSRTETRQVVREAATEMMRPATNGAVIILLVYVPILLLGGSEGKMFGPMAVTVCLALAGALVFSLTLVPVLAGELLKGDPEGHGLLPMERMAALYRRALAWTFGRKWIVAGTAGALIAAALLVFSRLGGEFLPVLDEGSFLFQPVRPNEISIDRSVEMQKRSDLIVRKFGEVERVFSRLGTAEIANDPMGVNTGDMFIMLKPRRKWPKSEGGRRRTKAQLGKAMLGALEKGMPGQEFLVTQPIKMRFDELLEGARADIAVKIFGPDFAVLNPLAERVKEALEKVPGAGDVEFEALGTAPAIDVRMDRAALTRYGVRPAAVNEAVSIGMGGGEAGVFYQEGKAPVPIVIRLPESMRESEEILAGLPVKVDGGGIVPLGKVAQIHSEDRVNTIVRERGRRRVAILVNLRGRDVESFAAEAGEKIKAGVKLPPGYTIEWGGQFKNLQQARRRFAFLVPVILAVIFFMIYDVFEVFWQVLVVFAGVPFAMVGGVLALALLGMPFSISAGVGFIALSGVAVLNGLVMVSSMNDLRRKGGTMAQAVCEGAVGRLRPVLMTALVASLGFLPMAVATGSGAEVQRPLAVVVIGGLLTATGLTLLMLPVLYRWVGSRVGAR